MGSASSCLSGGRPQPVSNPSKARKYQNISTDIQDVNVKALRSVGNSGSTIASDPDTVKLSGDNLKNSPDLSDMKFSQRSFQNADYTNSSSLFEDELLDKAEFLARNAWDRQVFIRYIIGDFWRGRVSPQLRRELAASAQWLKSSANANFDPLTGNNPTLSTNGSPNKRSSQYNDEVSSHSNFTSEDLQQILSTSQCQALLIASVISSFFIFRREVDFNVVLEDNSPALPSSIKGLSVDDDVHTLQDHLYEENGEFFLDPENILSMIAVSSAPEDLDKLLMHCNWLRHFASGLENLQVSIKVIELPKLSKGHSDDSDSQSCQSVSYALDPLLVFENPYHHSFASSLSSGSLSKIQAKNAISEMKATKGYVVLDHQDEHLPVTHFYASLPIPYVTSFKGLTNSHDNLFDDDTTVSQSTVSRDCRYVITAYHKFSGIQYEKNTLRVMDFLLLTMGAVLCQSV